MPERLDGLSRSVARYLRAEGKAPRTAVIYGQSVTFYSRWLLAQCREANVDELARSAVRSGSRPWPSDTSCPRCALGTRACTGSARGWSPRASSRPTHFRTPPGRTRVACRARRGDRETPPMSCDSRPTAAPEGVTGRGGPP